MKPVVILFFSLLAPLLLSSQQSKITSLLSVNEGLSQGMIFDVHQTRDGFIWIATKDGLNRYDGYRFEVFTNDSFDPFSIVSNEVWSIYEDQRGWLWLASPGGLDVYLPNTGRFFHLLPDLPGTNGDMVSFAELPDGTIWLTVNGKCWKIEGATEGLKMAAEAERAFPALQITEIKLADVLFSSVLLTQKGNVLLGSNQGLFQVSKTDSVPYPIALAGRPVNVFGQDQQGHVWIEAIAPDLTGLYLREDCGGLWLWEEEHASLRTIPCFPYGRHKFGPEGALWTWASMDITFTKWKPGAFINGESPDLTVTCDQDIIKNEAFHIRTVDFDRSGLVWLGTNGFGVLKMVTAPRKFTSYLEGTTQRVITEDPQGHLFAMGFRQTAYRSVQLDKAFPNPWATPFDPIDDRSITVFDKQGNAWVNSNRDSLFRIDARTKSKQYFPWKGLGLICTKDGKLLSVHQEGLLQLDPATAQSRLIPFDTLPASQLAFRYSHFLYEDPTGTIWIFAFKGLIEARPREHSYQYHYYRNDPGHFGSLSEDYVLSVAADPLEPARYLWVGTKGGGLNRLDRANGTFRHFKTQQGLPDNVVYGVLPDDHGHLWLSTNRGLCRFHTRKETTRNFTAADGLQSNEFNQSSYLRTRSGHLIFGGVNGLTVFYPDSLQFNEYQPTTAITRVWVNNELASYRAGARQKKSAPLLEATNQGQLYLNLTHRQNLLSVEFAALEYSNPAQNHYRYQLIRNNSFGQGETSAWVDLGSNNSVQLANLRPGHYQFRVLGSNNDGTWSNQPALLSFTIRPPWWATWWAYLAYILLTAWAVGLVYRIQLRQRLQVQEAFRLKELDQFKNRFFVNITHEFRTPLTVILGLSKQLKTSKTPLSAQESTHKIDLIQRNGENLLRLINQLLDLAKLESGNLKLNYIQGDVVPYLRYVAESLHSLAAVRGVSLQIDYPGDPIVMDYDPERLQQIVHNLLSNAIKFTPADGQVVLQTQVEKMVGQPSSQLLLLVRDTGVGIAPENLPHIFDRFHQATHLEKAFTGGTGIGLALTRELVHAMGGAIKVNSQVGKGTAFRVHLPIRQLAAPAQASPPEPPTISTDTSASPFSGKGQRQLPQLLIIEDNPDVVQYLTSCLKESFELSFAYNGADGINLAYEKIPDLIISDVMMPEKDGFEVCAALKEDERTSHIPIVLLTARAGVEDRIAGLRRGADAYLAKPFHEEELLITLNNLLKLRQKLQAKYAAFPDMPPQETKEETEGAFLQKIHTLVLEHHSDSNFSVEDLCRMIAMSQPQLHRKLTALTGKNATLFIRSVRLARGKALLQEENMTVSEVAYAVGFTDPKYFSRVFSNEFGLPPSKI